MKLLSFDLETHLIQPGLLAPPIVCGSVATNFGEERKRLLTKLEVWGLFQWLSELEVSELDEIALVGANIAYDFGCVLSEWPEFFPLVWNMYERGCVMDVQIAASLNAIAEGRMHDGDLYRRDGSKTKGRYSLDECVREWLGRGDAKGHDRWRLSYALLEDIPFVEWPWDAKQYPVDDAVNTLLVAQAQLPRLNGTDFPAPETNLAPAQNLQDLAIQCHAAFCLHLGSMWGLRTDPVAVDVMTKNVDSHIGELREWAVKEGFMRPKSKKPNAPLSVNTEAVKEAVFKAYDGLPPPTDGGDISYSRDTLEESGDPRLERFAEVGKWQKFNTYLPTLQEAARGPWNVKPNILVATGRTSYEGLIQLMPRKGGVRECFVARPGMLYSSVDYAAIEMSTLAQVCLWTVGFSDLAGAINSDADVHCILGADLKNISYGEFLQRIKEFKQTIRQGAKAGNFGFPGMMGPAKFVIAKRKESDSVCEWFFADGHCSKVMEAHDIDGKSLKLCKRCVEQATILREAFLGRWREVRPYWSWVMQELGADDDRLTQFISGRVRGGLYGPAGANTLFQGLAADGAKRAIIAMNREMYLRGDALACSLLGSPDEEEKVAALREKYGSNLESPLYGSRLCMFAHDETMLEIPQVVAHEAAYRQAEVMVSEMRTVVPDVKVKAEPALMKRWYKQAEAVFENGRLVPWEPKEKAA